MSGAKAPRAIVIGAGHNGLVCAGMLAREGVDVTVLEAMPSPGGMAGTAKFTDGYRVPHCAHLLLSPDARVVRDLRLHELGFDGVPPVTTLSLHPERSALRLEHDWLEGEDVSESDVDQYRRFTRLTHRFGEVLAVVARHPPPRIGDRSLAAHAELARLALATRSLRKVDIRELLRVGSSNVHDVLDDYLDHERVKAALAMDGVLGAALGPRSNNSMLNLLHRRIGAGTVNRPQFAVRAASGAGAGLLAFVSALGIAARDHGAVLRSATPVREVLHDGRRVAGVELEGGEQLAADVVVSSLDARSTLERLVGATRLDASLQRQVSHLRTQGRAAKLHLALGRMPTWRGVDINALAENGARQLRFLVAEDRRMIERAFDPSKYGEVPERPVIEFVLPSLHDATLCAPGRHVLSAVVQHAPYQPRVGLAAAREALERAALEVLQSVAPDLSDCIESAQLMLPADLEQQFGVTGGHWHHGELAVDQYLMLRPLNGYARYAGPLQGLFMCGAGTHPGGNVMGTAGYNAASVVLRALRRRA
jgi:phytoene dehydrogenase-like protein